MVRRITDSELPPLAATATITPFVASTGCCVWGSGVRDTNVELHAPVDKNWMAHVSAARRNVTFIFASLVDVPHNTLRRNDIVWKQFVAVFTRSPSSTQPCAPTHVFRCVRVAVSRPKKGG